MLDKAYQGEGVGSKIVNDCFNALKAAGFSHIRLGFAEGNPQSEAFWTKNGFTRTGAVDKQELYNVIVLTKDLI